MYSAPDKNEKRELYSTLNAMWNIEQDTEHLFFRKNSYIIMEQG